MAEAFYNATEGAGKKFHAWDRAIGANTVLDEFTLPGEFPYASYVVPITGVSVATAADHVVQLMAGASLVVRIRRIELRQLVTATTVTADDIRIFRLTTAGTGGASPAIGKFDNADSAPGASAMTLPTAKGTEGAQLHSFSAEMIQTRPNTMIYTLRWEQHPGMKPIIIPAGVANGIAIKTVNAVAAASVSGYIEFVETNF